MPFSDGTIRRAFYMVAVLVTTTSVAQVPAVATASDDLGNAQRQFNRSCGTCHAVEPGAPQRQGPNLGTVIGRVAGSLSDYANYSDALLKAGSKGLVWTEDTLDPWLTNASKFIPQSRMPYRQRNAEKRALVIRYLQGLASGQSNAQ